ncbi:sulfite exporter TauE/SafE family protein [Methylocaldum szegediense]|uniref:DsbD_2 domain-containing protein n=1 Tax=Methylocaldum szegediense TaxID=73780 RepID=A0ABN8X6C0_9GAMM|nr:sulfite exporter TauE/SafE family protein [Methylocaldum szegediense]CAI8904978.1 DsbD_2 domain-containing protein [Methylocaldum szegediense]
MHHLETAFSTSYLVALLMGLFSSLHCLGMCGSIIGSLTLSLRREIREQKSLLMPFVFSYNVGRITSYSLGGLLAGLAHHVLSMPLGEGHGHRILQIVSALIMAGAGLHIAGWFPRFAYIEKAGGGIWKRIEPYGRRLIPVETLPKAFVFGMIWGWLPCGLVYTALALAATTGDVVRSTFTMLAFGVGTLPAVMGVGIITSLLVRLSNMKKFRQAAGVTLIALALLAAFPWLNPMVRHTIG